MSQFSRMTSAARAIPDELFAQARADRAKAEEALIRRLLGCWVSEMPPAVAYDRRGNILGITIADCPLGSSPFILTIEAADAMH
jgi:hypothetical protein